MTQKSKIILTGFPKSGKTAIGRALSGLMGLGWHDLDALICGLYEKEQGIGEGLTCRQIWDRAGQDEFRRLEFGSLKEFFGLNAGSGFVLSLGGGAALDPRCRALLEESAGADPAFLIVALVTEREELYRRFSRFGFPRIIDPRSPRESFDKLYTERDRAYRALAGLVCDSGAAPVEDVARTLHARIKEFCS